VIACSSAQRDMEIAGKAVTPAQGSGEINGNVFVIHGMAYKNL